MSKALYRRYRPDRFQDVIGQEQVTAPLMAALRGDRTVHAYLFSGPRGTGKTTSARILARCLNCAQAPTDTPCGECESCRELASEGPGSIDVVEMDAASHGGVDDARDLVERAAIAPARDRYKIFIIDEAHMVSNQGFNALLKLVEEPPAHVKFIFATTEPEKVIGTIRSRTHHYPFRLVPPDTMEPFLTDVCQKEGIAPGPGVLDLVVRAGGGSVRDSLSVLDQLMGGTENGVIDYERARALLGYTDTALLDAAIEALIDDDGAGLFGVVENVVHSGHDPRRFVEDLLQRLRDLILVSMAGSAGNEALAGYPADQVERIDSQAERLGPRRASYSADLTNGALNNMVGATSPRLQLELLVARLLLPAFERSGEGSVVSEGTTSVPGRGGSDGTGAERAQAVPSSRSARPARPASAQRPSLQEEAARLAQEPVPDGGGAGGVDGGADGAAAADKARPRAASVPWATSPLPAESSVPAENAAADASTGPEASGNSEARPEAEPARVPEETAASAASATSEPSAPDKQPRASVAAETEERSEPSGEAGSEAGADAEADAGSSSDELAQVRQAWDSITSNALLKSVLQDATPVAVRAGTLTLAFRAGSNALGGLRKNAGLRARVRARIAEVTGQDLNLELVDEGESPAPKAEAVPETATAQPQSAPAERRQASAAGGQRSAAGQGGQRSAAGQREQRATAEQDRQPAATQPPRGKDSARIQQAPASWDGWEPVELDDDEDPWGPPSGGPARPRSGAQGQPAPAAQSGRNRPHPDPTKSSLPTPPWAAQQTSAASANPGGEASSSRPEDSAPEVAAKAMDPTSIKLPERPAPREGKPSRSADFAARLRQQGGGASAGPNGAAGPTAGGATAASGANGVAAPRPRGTVARPTAADFENEEDEVSPDDPTVEQARVVGLDVVLEKLNGTIIEEIDNTTDGGN